MTKSHGIGWIRWESHMYILGVTSIEVMSFIGHGTLMADSDITRS